MHWVSKKRKRKLLHEAFVGGWQAALGVNVTNPRVLAVLESCFELWLEEATGEVDVLGLRFRRRWDLPKTKLPPEALDPFRQQPPMTISIPAQRTGSADGQRVAQHRADAS
ncbi:MAG TPA: hypothetical protein VFJ09_15200 [Nocardioidaceae bacterium]|nr:hypothetical protein [Nocardioidaceae bacterium]